VKEHCYESLLEADTKSIPVCPVVLDAPLSPVVRDLAYQMEAALTECYFLARRLELLKQPAESRSAVRLATSSIELLLKLPWREMALGLPMSLAASHQATGFKALPGNELQSLLVANMYDALSKALSPR